MTQEEFNSIDWKRGNIVKLRNDKEYLVKGTKSHGKYLLLYSEEYDKCFVADYKIVDCRTSDYEEPIEVYLEMKRKKQEEAQARRDAEREEYLRMKEERKQRNLQEQERIHQEALARKAARAKANAAKNADPTKPAKKAEPAKAAPQPAPQPKPVAKAKPVETKPVATAKAEPVVATKADPVVVTKAEPAPEQPKKKRKRILISRAEKVEIK